MRRKQTKVADRGAKLAAEYRAGEESRKAFCQRHGITLTALAYFLRRESRRESGSRLLPVELQTSATAEKRRLAGVTLALASGLRVELEHGFDESVLSRVLTVLERR